MDKNTIKEVSIYLTAQSVSDSRHARYLWTLKQIAAEVPTTHTLKRLDKSDILKVGVHITKFSKYTKDEYRKTLRLLNKVSLKKLPELPKTKNRKRYNKECHPRETILEVINLIPHNSEEYKLGNFLWDSGGRTGEGFNLITGWVYPDLHGCRARMVGKTGDRVIRLLENPEILINQIKGKSRDDYVFETNYGKFRRKLQKAGDKIGVKIKPYDLRHSRYTELGPYMSSAVKRAYFGWGPNSKIPETYDHLTGDVIDPFVKQIPQMMRKQQTQQQYTTTRNFNPMVSRNVWCN